MCVKIYVNEMNHLSSSQVAGSNLLTLARSFYIRNLVAHFGLNPQTFLFVFLGVICKQLIMLQSINDSELQ